MSTLPKSQIEMAALTVSVAKKWRDKYPTYGCNFTDPNALEAMGQEFLNSSAQNVWQTTDKRANTRALRIVNEQIDAAIKKLKKYIQFEYMDETKLADYYVEYGMKNETGCHYLPKDNESRVEAMGVLISKLSEAGNPFATNGPGLAYFQTLRTELQLRWEQSKDKKSDKSIISGKTNKFLKEAEAILSKLAKQIKLEFSEADATAMLRGMGFLKEIY